MYTSEDLADDTRRFVDLVMVGQYEGVDSLRLRELAQGIIDPEEGHPLAERFCNAVNDRLRWFSYPRCLTPTDSPFLAAALRRSPGTHFLSFGPNPNGKGHSDEASRRADCDRTHHFVVTDDGIKYAGQVSYDALRPAHQAAA